jgi:hypothetical protein
MSDEVKVPTRATYVPVPHVHVTIDETPAPGRKPAPVKDQADKAEI